tara:strand:- start:215 stop:1063 length:849 start_codon:yes stop_codon:yes gene_type:complete
VKNDKFYTNQFVAKKCVSLAEQLDKFSNFDVILEPSAGTGSFYQYLPVSNRLGIDLEPKHQGIIKMNFFDFIPAEGRSYYVIGNPPFGRVNSLAVKFFNYSASFARKIAFILPRTFRRLSVQNRLNLNFYLQLDVEIPLKSFIPSTMMAKCVFQIWERKIEKRKIISLPTTHKDFIFLHEKDSYKADFALRAYGGNCGEISTDVKNIAPRSWHFIQCDNPTELMNIFKRLDYSISKDTARQDSIGRAELVQIYQKFRLTNSKKYVNINYERKRKNQKNRKRF